MANGSITTGTDLEYISLYLYCNLICLRFSLNGLHSQQFRHITTYIAQYKNGRVNFKFGLAIIDRLRYCENFVMYRLHHRR